MRVASSNDAQLMLALHQGLLERPQWNNFLINLRAEGHADTAAIQLQLRAGGRHQFVAGKPLPECVTAMTSDREFAPGDSARMRPGRVYAEHELIDYAVDQPLKAIGNGEEDRLYFRSVMVQTPTGSRAWMTLTAQQELAAATSSLLGRLSDHLQTALITMEALFQANADAKIAHHAASTGHLRWLALGANGDIVDASPDIESGFAGGIWLRRNIQGALRFAHSTVESRVRDFLKKLFGGGAPEKQALTLSIDPMVVLTLADARAITDEDTKDIVAFGYLCGLRDCPDYLPLLLIDLFALAPSEARFAASLALGHSIADAADEHGLTIETARNYSKKIYVKTGVSGQVQLVHKVVSLLSPML